MKLHSVLFHVLIFLGGSLFAQQTSLTYVSHTLENNRVTVEFTDGISYEFTPFNDRIIEARRFEGKRKRQIPSHAVVMKPDQTDFVLEETDERITVKTNGLSFFIAKTGPAEIQYAYLDNPLTSELVAPADSTKLTFSVTTPEKLMGGGARALGMNRRGTRLKLYNQAHYGYEERSELLNYTLPIALSSNQYLLHFDNSFTGYLDLAGSKEDQLSFEPDGGDLVYQIVAGNTWTSILDAYTKLTGRQPMPPRWALGNFASRFGYHSQQEVVETVKKFKNDSIPLDAIILDIYWFGKEIKGSMGNLEFLKDSFPNPKKMIADLAQDDINTILITEPFILTSSSKWDIVRDNGYVGKDSLGNPYTYDFYFGNTGLVDLYNPKAKEWFWSVYKGLIDSYGVAGQWGDLGEPEVHPADMIHGAGIPAKQIHNTYGHDWAGMIAEGYQKDFPDQRPFILMRAGYSGSQRHGIIPWSGDVSRSWGGLKPQVEIATQMGLQGLGYMHSDLGGFAGGETFDAELYTRWLQYGVFQPICRPHAQEHIAPEPVFHDAETKQLAKQAIELRYQLLPYNYTLAYQNSRTGIPLMRPLFFEEPNNLELYEVSDQYLWGDAFMIAPVTASGVTTKQVYFPKGSNWIDFYTKEVYPGGSSSAISVTKEYIPTFVKEGSFIPMIETIQSTADYSTDIFMLHYFTSNQLSSGTLFEDDGKTPNTVKNGKYRLLRFHAVKKKNTHYIGMTTLVGKNEKPKNRRVNLVVHGVAKKPRSLRINDKKVTFEYSETENQLRVDVDWNASTTVDLQIKQ
ncbi:hypothetical protein GCM10009117_14850 [Gangjinia marincola]|uniref:Uncharacterized protein n=1 Tax=Gangjinia marincola TaxID=578463 RepID=A0ABN1MGN6_9FLAO